MVASALHEVTWTDALPFPRNDPSIINHLNSLSTGISPLSLCCNHGNIFYAEHDFRQRQGGYLKCKRVLGKFMALNLKTKREGN